LSVEYGRTRPVHAVNRVNFTVWPGEFVGLVGESGCGKSTLGYAIARLVKPPAYIREGSVVFRGQDLLKLSGEALRRERWEHLSLVLQSGMNALNPLMTVEQQFFDTMRQHTDWPLSRQRERIEELLDLVHVDRKFMRAYPHQLSGGMKQRVAIALALTLEPELIIMDEPTTALDVVVQREILENLREIRRTKAFAMIFISHDLGLVLELVDRVAVMYAGEIVEEQPAEWLYREPLHPYTQALLESVTGLDDERRQFHGIAGSPPDLREELVGCPFYPRCTAREEGCTTRRPQLTVIEPQRLVRCFVAERSRVHV
jgi:peptide/nickel transport system ATP-binding protein